MGEIPPSSFEFTLEQLSMSLEQLLKDQQESHHHQLASSLAANVALHKENATLRNATIPTPHLDIPIAPRSPARFESTDNFSLPSRRDYLHASNPRSVWSLSLTWRSLDPALRALDDMSLSPFVPAILNHDASPHFALPKFQMYDGL